MGEWCPIESDPGVFTELIRQIGVKGMEVDEIYSIDALSDYSPVYGLIFLFKWESVPKPPRSSSHDPALFFAQQVIQNACATQAILSVLLNKSLDLGSELSRLKEFAMPLDPNHRGLAISNSDLIRTTHNSFAQQEPFEFTQSKSGKNKSEIYHFVSYIHFNGKIYELDGMQTGPILHAECEESEWIERIKPILASRMDQFSGSEIRFNLMALVQNKRDLLRKMGNALQLKILSVKTKLMSLDQEVGEEEMEGEFDEEYFNSLTDDLDLLQAELGCMIEEKQRVGEDLRVEDRKYRKWMIENQRRKHNYVPFILSLLEKLADEEKLVPLLESAKERKEKTPGK